MRWIGLSEREPTRQVLGQEYRPVLCLMQYETLRKQNLTEGEGALSTLAKKLQLC